MADRSTLDDIRRIVTRKSIPPGQITLYKALYEAGYNRVSKTQLADKIRWSDDESLIGVLGALGNRVVQTEGLSSDASVFDLMIERGERNGELYYRMLPDLRTVINSLPTLREAMALSVEEIHAKFNGEANWLVID